MQQLAGKRGNQYKPVLSGSTYMAIRYCGAGFNHQQELQTYPTTNFTDADNNFDPSRVQQQQRQRSSDAYWGAAKHTIILVQNTAENSYDNAGQKIKYIMFITT
jgi:hypothetical protein